MIKKTITLTVEDWERVANAVERYFDDGSFRDPQETKELKITKMRFTLALIDAKEEEA